MDLLIGTAWESLLALRASIGTAGAFSEKTLFITKGTIEIADGLQDIDGAICITNRPHVFQELKAGFLWHDGKLQTRLANASADPVLHMLKLYLPYCYLSLLARQLNRAVTVSHFAQTLDGKIATETGSSKWIGNQENLVHAHRMRSLVDGVLVGSNTYFKDNPRLTVRHVQGDNPVKIIISSSNAIPADDSFLVIVPEKIEQRYPNVMRVQSKGGIIPCSAILSALYERGIKTLYIEGGAFTTSCFLKSKLIDYLQIHFSNKILGSGKNSFLLSPVAEISDSLHLKDHQYFHIGNEIMITGNVAY